MPPTKADLLNGRIKLWECVDDSGVVGHRAGDLGTGEVLILGVIRGYEGLGIGRTLLSRVVNWLLDSGAPRIWLLAPTDSNLRAFGFYRALGWRATEECPDTANEILELPAGSHDWLST
jgi:GNAT superfamily N-acetyltransferase